MLIVPKRLKVRKDWTIEFTATQSNRLMVSELSKNKILLFQAVRGYSLLGPRERIQQHFQLSSLSAALSILVRQVSRCSPHLCIPQHVSVPEIVARRHIVFQVPGVEASEGISGQAEGGSSVKVAVPPDLDTHDASLWGEQERHR